MKDKIETNSDAELVELFNQANTTEEKLRYFSKILDDNCKMELLNTIPEKEKYKFIGKLKSPKNIAEALNSLGDDKTKNKTFNFIAKQFKGNNIGLLNILTQIDFNVVIPPNMLTFNLNNINTLNLDFLINIQRHVENYSEMKFKINEDDDSRHIEYSFSEISAIIAKIEELTADIPKDMDEANRFYTIYSRITSMMTYDHNCIRESDKVRDKFISQLSYPTANYKADMHRIRKNAAGLYGGLINGKSICAGYALILHETLKYVGMKSQYVGGDDLSRGKGHAWNQVQIDGKWYNADPTWDSDRIQTYGKYKYMLLNDQEFDQTHGKYSQNRTKTYHKCKSKFDYGKIQGLSPKQIISEGWWI